MTNRSIGLEDRLYEYLLSVSLRESEPLRRLRAETAGLAVGEMQIAPEQGQFMAVLVELLGVRNAIEIGTFTGYSALCVAQSMGVGGRLICCDTSREWTDVARRYWREAGVEQRIELHLKEGLTLLDEMLVAGRTGEFDFVFIDADKKNYEGYFERSLRLLRPGGLIAVDNTLWDGSVIDSLKKDTETEAIREFNAQRYRDKRISLSLVPIGDGLTLARKH